MINEKLKNLVDEYTRWDRLQREAKVEIDKIKAQIQEIALPEIENSKHKSARYFGTSNNIVTVTTSETVKLISYSFLKAVLGETIEDFIKEEKSYKIADPFKKIVAPLCLGNYIEQKLADVIAQMNVDEKTAKVLKKKLKGDAQKDAKVLESLGISPKDIEHWAYFIAEAMAYEKIVKMLEVAGHKEGTPEFEAAIADMKLAVITEEGLKIGIEYEDEDSQPQEQ